MVTTAEAVLTGADEGPGSSVSRVGVVLLDEVVVGLATVVTAVDTALAVSVAGGVGLLSA